MNRRIRVFAACAVATAAAIGLSVASAPLEGPVTTVRPSLDDVFEFTRAQPAVRVHVPQDLAATLADRNDDGVPDRVRLALDSAARLLTFCETRGLGTPLDDGDGELDIYFAREPDDAQQVVARFDGLIPPGRGAAGFVIADPDPRHDDNEFTAGLGRALARLVLAGRDARASTWWLEASASWIQARVSGASFDLLRSLQARWNHPEVGYATDDPLLARGNVGLLWSLEDTDLEERVVATSWNALAARGATESARDVIERALVMTTGLDLADLQRRAATAHLVSGMEPDRYALRISQLPAIAAQPLLPIARDGLALALIEPDPRHPEGTALEIDASDGAWRLTLLARRREGGWDSIDPRRRTPRGALELALPWQDYDRGVLLIERGRRIASDERIELSAASAGPAAPFALSSLAARRRADGYVEISWSSAWETGLFGWVVEQAPAPEGPWRRIQDLPVPALGLPAEGTGYSVLEPRRENAFPSYYRVVGVTVDGLRISGPVVAAGGLP